MYVHTHNNNIRKSNCSVMSKIQNTRRWALGKLRGFDSTACLFQSLWGTAVRTVHCCHHLAGKGCSVAPQWPRLTAHLQRCAGGRLLSLRIWPTHLLWGQPGRQCHWLLGGRPIDRLTWQLADTTRHNRHNGLLPVPPCYSLITDLSFMWHTCYGETVVMGFGLNQQCSL